MPRNRKAEHADYSFNLYNVGMSIEFEDGLFEEDEMKYITECLDCITEKISVDKTYVMSKNNKRDDVYIRENGWKMLCMLIEESDFLTNIDKSDFPAVVQLFNELAIGYVVKTLSLYTDKIDHVNLSISPDAEFDVEICKDTSECKDYVPKWQFWDVDDSGNLVLPTSKMKKSRRKK